jgi:endogenous inhibitor of DNA gyrase (YacG/DUF329 family)
MRVTRTASTLSQWQRVCPQCGKPFEVRRAWQAFCDPRCKAKAYWKRRANAVAVAKQA